MPVSESYLIFVQDQLSKLGPIQIKKMFGGASLYFDNLIFGLIDDDTLYFKADTITKSAYSEQSMPQFAPYMKNLNKPMPMPYWQVPEEVLNDPDVLFEWAKIAIQVALSMPKKKRKIL